MTAGPANVKRRLPIPGCLLFFALFLGYWKNILNFAVYY